MAARLYASNEAQVLLSPSKKRSVPPIPANMIANTCVYNLRVLLISYFSDCISCEKSKETRCGFIALILDFILEF